MDPKIIEEMIKGLRIEVVWTLVLSGLVFYILLAIKDFLNTLLNYFKFRGNHYVSIGTMVEVNNFVGRIKDISIGFIVVEGECGYYRISMQNWQKHKWIFLRTQRKKQTSYDGKRLGLRKSDDIKIDRDSDEYKDIVAQTKVNK